MFIDDRCFSTGTLCCRRCPALPTLVLSPTARRVSLSFTPTSLHPFSLVVHLPALFPVPCYTMASFAPTSGLSSLLKDGTKHISGVDAAVLKNIDACTQLGALVSTSLGPHARRKIVVNRLGKLFVTSDAATILRELEVIHPAAQMLVKAAEAQEREAGDGTAAVVILASALLENAEKMLRMGLHTSEIIAGMAAWADGVVEVVGDRLWCLVEGRAALRRGSGWWLVGYRSSSAGLALGPWLCTGLWSLLSSRTRRAGLPRAPPLGWWSCVHPVSVCLGRKTRPTHHPAFVCSPACAFSPFDRIWVVLTAT